MRVLIAEDDRITRRMLQRQLEQWGHEVVAVENGAEAWHQICQETFSLVISDWMMPEMDGLELARRIRDTSHRRYVYIILLTAKTETDDIVAGMDAGADDFLSKPFERNELRVRIRAGQRILELEQRLAEHNEQLREVNQRMSNDLEAAARVQRSLLPDELPEIEGIRLAWSFQPCDELAGDFLNVFPLDERHLALYVCDVSGHGVASSLLSVTISRVLTVQPSLASLLLRVDQQGNHHIVSPTDVLGELNRRFPMDDSGMYFTLVYGVLDTETKKLQYASAGHPPMLRLSGGASAQFAEGEGLAIGWEPEAEFSQQELQLAPGDRLFLYSDGVPEAMNQHLEPFDNERLVDACRAGREQPLQDSVDALLAAVERWCGVSDPKDDVSILALEIV